MGCEVTFLHLKSFLSLFSLKFDHFSPKNCVYNSFTLNMVSVRIPVHEVRKQMLDLDLDKVYSSFSDETEQEISDHHKSESSDEITKGNEIFSTSGDSDTEVDSNGMFLFVWPSNNFYPFDFTVVFAFSACIIYG